MFFYNLMHVVHLIAVILWIGGLAFITTMIFPIIIKTADPLGKVLLFRKIEHRFARTARVYNIITGASGLIMLLYMGWQDALYTRHGLSLLVMILIWVFWFIMLFGLEPLVIRKMLERMMEKDTDLDIDAVFGRMNKMHWILLVVSLIAVASGACFAHSSLLSLGSP
ncbi:MAG: hypothetical protein ACE5EZ_05880 [Thermodesulfobacteriota bacterium]